jgi:H+/Cl- antiporter ClcA
MAHQQMQQQFIEEITLFLSIIKWTILATIIGFLAGGATALFLHSLDAATTTVHAVSWWVFLLPVGAGISGWLIQRFATDAQGHGTEQVISAIHEHKGHIPFRVTPVKWVATVITIATGGSAGKEGPCAQIGGSIASACASLLHVSKDDRRKLVVCGISAGFAAVFGTPIAGALFAIEVLFLGQLLYDMLYPSFVAGIVGYHAARLLGVTYVHHMIPQLPPMDGVGLIGIVAAGILFGLCSLMLIEMMKLTHLLFNKYTGRPAWRPIIGGVLVLGLALTVSTDYLGLSVAGLEDALNGAETPAFAFFWKTLFTSITLGSGGSGGVITPIFYIGATLGNILAPLFNMPAAILASVGMVALLSGAANTPIAASIMAIEFFGPTIGPYACMACITAYLASGHRSIYTSQRLGMRKSEALKVPVQEMVGEIERVELGADAERLLVRIRRLIHRATHRNP